jgi:hypothetical protein
MIGQLAPKQEPIVDFEDGGLRHSGFMNFLFLVFQAANLI